MAKVNFFLGDIVGKLAGLVFQGGTAGAVLKSKGTAKQSVSPEQSIKRSVFSYYSRRWAYTLTELQRDEWSALAGTTEAKNAFGASYLLTGQNLFQRLNVNLDTGGYTGIDDAPDDLDVESILTLIYQELITGTDPYIMITTPVLPVGHTYVVRSQQNASQGISSPGNLKSTPLESELVGSGEFEVQTIPSGATKVLGKAVWSEVSFLNTVNGMMSPGVLLKGTVVAPPP